MSYVRKISVRLFLMDTEELMQPKIFWIDNLRGIACLMVVMIHTTTWYITNAQSVSPMNWDLANVLNSASRVSVPLFFMISGYLFFGERSAKPRHFLRITLCILFYSSVALAYILLFTSIIGLFFAPAIMALTRWLDKRSLLIVMMLVSAAFVAAAKFTGISTVAGMMLFTFVFCIGSSAYWQLMPAMIYDICEYDELETGNRREGSIVSLLSVAEALSQAIAIQMLGIILQLAGFNGEAAAQTPAALEWVENSLMLIPSAFMALTVGMVYFYPITKKKFEEIQAELQKR